MPPKVSVCIPTYNYANYISETLKSVLAQTFEDYEVIIQDDCSNDNTDEVVKQYLSDPRISFGRNDHNLGLAGNWNCCMAKAKGEYIKYVFADDILASRDALSEMVAILDSHPEVTLVASARNIIDSESHIQRVESRFEEDLIARGTDIISICLYRLENMIGEPSVAMFRKAQASRGFQADYIQMVDLEMWFHLLEQGEFAFLNRPLCSFRVHPAQKTADNHNELVHLDDYYRILRDYLGKPYIKAGWVVRKYWPMDTLYQCWKLYKRRPKGKPEAVKMIKELFPRFFFVYPFYKVVKPFVKSYVSTYTTKRCC